MKGKLVLEDGKVFSGELLSQGEYNGSIVFSTDMTGYEELLKDKSMLGQILVLAYPIQGSFGIKEIEKNIGPGALIVRELTKYPSHFQSKYTLSEYLKFNEIVCLQGVDTRALIKYVVKNGAIRGTILPE